MTPNLRTYNSSSVVLVVWQELPIWLRPVKRWTPTSYFNSCLAHRPHVSSENGHRKRVFSKTPCRAEIFKNTAGLSFTRGWTKHDVMHYLLLALRMLCEGCYRILIVFPSFENNSNALRVDAYFFANGGEKSLFQNYPDTCWRGLKKWPLRQTVNVRFQRKK